MCHTPPAPASACERSGGLFRGISALVSVGWRRGVRSGARGRAFESRQAAPSLRVPRITVALAGFATLIAFSSASAQLVSEMTHAKIQEAIAFGTSQKETPMYRIKKGGVWGTVYKPVLGYFTTPFARV